MKWFLSVVIQKILSAFYTSDSIQYVKLNISTNTSGENISIRIKVGYCLRMNDFSRFLSSDSPTCLHTSVEIALQWACRPMQVVFWRIALARESCVSYSDRYLQEVFIKIRQTEAALSAESWRHWTIQTILSGCYKWKFYVQILCAEIIILKFVFVSFWPSYVNLILNFLCDLKHAAYLTQNLFLVWCMVKHTYHCYFYHQCSHWIFIRYQVIPLTSLKYTTVCIYT